jgi:hypothetical protein
LVDRDEPPGLSIHGNVIARHRKKPPLASPVLADRKVKCASYLWFDKRKIMRFRARPQKQSAGTELIS